MITAWSHLPNARYIDLILSSVKEYPEAWIGACIEASNIMARSIAMQAAWAAVGSTARGSNRIMVWNEVWNSLPGASWSAGAALIAWDDCAYMIESEVGELKILAAFGDHRAILLLPACIALNSIKEMEIV